MDKVRWNIQVRGIVQGVGFRPFIHRIITDHGLKGWVRNSSSGAEIEIEGMEAEAKAFLRDLEEKKPALVLLEDIRVEKKEELKNYAEFSIISSDRKKERDTLISPDVCTCEDCVKELFDKKNRRYRYPFINCTNCGPRFTIIKDIPYDRDKTTMASFPMCPDCEKEYTDIENRRYHAEPTCCEDCGPELFYVDEEGNRIKGDPIEEARRDLLQHKIVAIKGLGGFHLACLIDEEETIRRLRKRKQRDEKPFALMCRDVEEAGRYACISKEEEKILTSPQRPIVLLRKKEKDSLKEVSENSYVGIMLPYTPVHFLLFEKEVSTLIMTSANLSDKPIIYRNEEALEELKGIADGFLLNNRDIHVRCDDSLVYVYEGKEYFVRRSRGYVPYPITIERNEKMILACGAEQKASFALSKASHVFLSQHIGDLKNMETLENYEGQIAHFEHMFDIRPSLLVHDLHPDYFSSVYAEERADKEKLPIFPVQHHHAHMVSCMADNSLHEKVIGIIWDGTGLGTDGTVWGGEFLVGDETGFERRGSLYPFPLPGGDKVTKEVWRMGIVFAEEDAKKHYPEEKTALVQMMIKNHLNAPLSSSMGRLFDGAASLIGIRQDVSYEGQAAVLLQAEAEKEEKREDRYSYEILKEGERYLFDYRPMMKEILKDDSSKAVKSQRFMNTLIDMAVSMCDNIQRDTGISRVVCSGGTFQNLYLLEGIERELKKKGFSVYHHHRVSCNDEGICLGQLMIGRYTGKE